MENEDTKHKPKFTDMFRNQKTVSGHKALLRSMNYNNKGLIDAFGLIADLGKKAYRLKKNKVPSQIAKLNDKQRFNTLMNLYGKKPSDLPALRESSFIAFWTFSIALLFFMLLFGYHIIKEISNIDIWNAVVLATITLILTLKILRSGQQNYIYRKQSDINLRTYLTSGELLPKK